MGKNLKLFHYYGAQVAGDPPLTGSCKLVWTVERACVCLGDALTELGFGSGVAGAEAD